MLTFSSGSTTLRRASTIVSCSSMAWEAPRVIPAGWASSRRPGPRDRESADVSVVDGDTDIVPADLDRVDRDRLDRGEAERLAGPDVEPGAVPRAADLRAVELPLGERAAVMGAD